MIMIYWYLVIIRALINQGHTQSTQAKVTNNEKLVYTQQFLAASGTEFQLWKLLPSAMVTYYMVNSCGIKFESISSNQDNSVISRDQVRCYNQQNISTKPNSGKVYYVADKATLESFQQGALSVRGDRTIIELTISDLPIHTHVRVMMEIMFILPLEIVDAIFKVYYDKTSGYFFKTECGFFTSDDNNRIFNCDHIDPRAHTIRYLEVDNQFEHPCDRLNLVLEFVAKWRDNISMLQYKHDQPYVLMTNLRIYTSKLPASNEGHIAVASILDFTFFIQEKSQVIILSPFGCNQSYDAYNQDLNLFSTQGVFENSIPPEYMAIATIYRRKCCSCFSNYVFTDEAQCKPQTSYWLETVSDISESTKLLKNRSSPDANKSAPLSQYQLTSVPTKQQLKFAYSIYCNPEEYKAHALNGNAYDYTVQFLDSLVTTSFNAIFGYPLSASGLPQVLTYNNALVDTIHYELTFYGDPESNECVFDILDQLEIQAQAHYVIPSILTQTIIFKNSKSRDLKFVVYGQFRIVGFTSVTFSDIIFDVSNQRQEDRIIAILIKPMVLDASFTLLNITIVKEQSMRVMQLKFILDEFQGSVTLKNLYFENLQWLQQHYFLEFSQSNRFIDKLYEAKIYKPETIWFYNILIQSIQIVFCVFDASVTLFTFPTTNVQGRIFNLTIQKSKFAQGSSVLASFSNLEPAQIEKTQMKRQLTIANVILSDCTFVDSSRFISVSLQKVVASTQAMKLTVANITMLNTQFNDFSIFFYNDHSYFDHLLVNLRIENVTFDGSAYLIFENSEFLKTQQRTITILKLELIWVSYLQNSMIMNIRNKNVNLTQITFHDQSSLRGNTQPRQFSDQEKTNEDFLRGTLIFIYNFQQRVHLTDIDISGTAQSSNLLMIQDQIPTSPRSSISARDGIRITRCQFKQITLVSQGTGQLAGSPLNIYSIRARLTIVIQECVWRNNTHRSSIYSQQLSPTLIIDTYYGHISLIQCIFEDNWGMNAQSGVTITSSTTVQLIKCNFTESSYGNLEYKGKGGHAQLYAQNITIIDSNFSYANASTGGSIYITHYIKERLCQVVIEGCSFEYSMANASQNNGDGGVLVIEFNVDQNSEKFETLANVTLLNSRFSNNSAESGSGVLQILPNILTNLSLTVSGCEFVDNFGLKSFVIDISLNDDFIVKNQSVHWDLVIANSSFHQTLSEQDVLGRLQRYLNNTVQWDTQSFVRFREIFNSVHFSSSNLITNTIHLMDTSFIGNKHSSMLLAEIINEISLSNVTVAMSYSLYCPILYAYGSTLFSIINSQFSSNQQRYPIDNELALQEQHHLLISSFVIIQQTRTVQIKKSKFNGNTCPSCINGFMLIAKVLDLQVEGCEFSGNTMVHGGGIVIRKVTSIVQIQALTQGLNTISQKMSHEETFISSMVRISSCQFTANKVSFGGGIFITVSLNSRLSLQLDSVVFANNTATNALNIWAIGYLLESFGIEIDNQELFPGQIALEYEETQDLPNDLSDLNQGFPSNMIELGCPPGEFYDSELQLCLVCQSGSYLLRGNQFQCKMCPLAKASHCEGNLIKLLPGFWRESNVTDVILACSVAELCVSQGENICAIGHSGALCLSCDLNALTWNKSYTKSGDRVCIACDFQVFQVVRTVVVLLVVFVGMIIAVGSTVRNITLEICIKYLRYMRLFVGSRYRDSLYAAVYLKILATHFIVVTLVLNLNLPIPDTMVGIFSGIGSPLDQMLLSQDCFLQGSNLPLPPLYFRVFMSILYPFIFYFCFIVMKVCQSGFQNAHVKKGTYSVGALFIILYMQPNLFKITMGIISCTEPLDGKYYVATETNYECYTNQYFYYFYSFALPLLIFTCVIIPIGLLICLFNNRKGFDKCVIRFRYGYLILGYSEDKKKPIARFWEIVVIYKKVITLALLNYFSGSTYNQGLLMIFTLLFYFVILKAFSPYKSDVLNSADEHITLMQCYIMVIALLLDVNRDSQTFIWMGLMLLFFCNGYAIYVLFVGVFEDFKQEFNTFMTKYYYGQRCQVYFPCLAGWFKQRKITTNRIQFLWKKAYNQLIGWRQKYIELTEDLVFEGEYERAIAKVKRMHPQEEGKDDEQIIDEKIIFDKQKPPQNMAEGY